MPRAKKAVSIETYREQLEERRQQILDLYESDLQAGKDTGAESADDIVDRANNAYTRELLFSLTGEESEQLKTIDEAISRLDDGGFGVCTSCGTEIGEPRLQAVPWARYCIDCQEKAEQGLLDE